MLAVKGKVVLRGRERERRVGDERELAGAGWGQACQFDNVHEQYLSCISSVNIVNHPLL